MKKRNITRNTLISLVIIGFTGLGLFFKERAFSSEPHEQDPTEIYIINGDHEENGWFEGPSKSELLKALLEYPEHLFITPSLWKSFCYHRAEQLKQLAHERISSDLDNLEIIDTAVYNKNNKAKKLSQNDERFFNLATVLAFDETEWDFFDTHIGLYYLRPKDAINDIGLKLEACTKIENPCALKIEIKPRAWVDGFISLFDIDRWHQAHKNHKKKVVCFSGHGTPRACKVARACGISTTDFIKIMLFFNDTLKINTLGIQSCYWPSTRILELMTSDNNPYLNLQLITPIDQERALYFAAEMPIVWSYEPTTKMSQIQESAPGEIFLNGLSEIATSFDGTMTEELAEKINRTHVVQINHKYNMKTGLIDAGASQPIFV